MKKIKYLVSLLIIPLLLIPMVVNASDAKIKISSSESKLKVGNIIPVNVTITSNTSIGYYEYTLDYNSKALKLMNSNSYVVDSPNDNSTKKVSKDFKFKVLKDSNTKVSVRSYSITSFKGSKNISTSVEPLSLSGSSNSSSSSEVYLKSLSIDGAKLDPEFNKNTTEYKLILDNDISKITINAKANESDYDIDGTGEFEIASKDKFEVTVSDEDGNSKTYTLKMDKTKAKEIKVKVDGKDYLLISDANSYKDIPNGFSSKKIKINDEEINALYNEKTEQTLVVLKDEDGNLGLFLYDEKENTYSKYEVITFEKVSFIPITYNKVKTGYKKDVVKINDVDVNCIKLNANGDYALIYGMNAENGDKGWYSYDIVNNTIQKYNKEIDDYYKEKENNTRKLIYILAGTSIFFGILVIILAIKFSNKKRRY